MAAARLLALVTLARSVGGLLLSGVDIPHAKISPISRALDGVAYPDAWPYAARDFQPEDAGNDGLFYALPKFVHHAGAECRACLTRYYAAALPRDGGAVLDLCSSWTSHYPPKVGAARVAAVGLNPLELLANPSKTEWARVDLNADPALPYGDAEFDVVTNALSVDYLTSPRELFAETRRVLKPGGLAAMAFTNRCFPTKVVPVWTRPFSEVAHARLVATYFHFAGFTDISVADVSPDGWTGQRDPMVVVQARRPGLRVP